ncbi:MAG: RtcB family protein [Verrucomicrobia bacterium]|nr:RtcB family protein [Verrucomicrobiota bacterium]
MASDPESLSPDQTVPLKRWGTDIEPEAANQMAAACHLPIALQAALMPDAHVGYGLPIGGVLATRDAVIPYAVGVDIACRMRLTIFDEKPDFIPGQRDRLKNIIADQTRFGVGAEFTQPKDHPVMDEDWSVSPVTQAMKLKAWLQLGTSGSGNHFVEFGALRLDQPMSGLNPGSYLALLSHSGSRGTGAQVCTKYSKRAAELHPEIPPELKRLAWLSLSEADGQEYWAAMTLMGQYAAANHDLIHQGIAKDLGIDVLATVENHHNFAWREHHVIAGVEQEVIVHRKGATPAGLGVLGIIPGSMVAPGFLVRGKGEPSSLTSASHGAGRIMSRQKALETFTWSGTRKLLAEHGVDLISAGLDEVPGVYKDIHTIMAAQKDLVEAFGQFEPKLVKMSPAGERPEE